MKKRYKKYIRTRFPKPKDGMEIIITKDDIVIWQNTGNDGWAKNELCERFMAGDIALDNGFEFVESLTEAQAEAFIFAEML